MIYIYLYLTIHYILICVYVYAYGILFGDVILFADPCWTLPRSSFCVQQELIKIVMFHRSSLARVSVCVNNDRYFQV